MIWLVCLTLIVIEWLNAIWVVLVYIKSQSKYVSILSFPGHKVLQCYRYENIKLQTYQSVTLSVSSIFKNNLNVTLYKKFFAIFSISSAKYTKHFKHLCEKQPYLKYHLTIWHHIFVILGIACFVNTTAIVISK